MNAKINNIRSALIVFLVFFMISSIFGTVEVFSEYNTEIKLNSNQTIDVHKSILLQNIHTVGIVPGSIEFKISRKLNNSDSEIKLSNVRIYDRYNNSIKFKIVETADYNIIALDIFSPLLPGFEYKMDLYYTLEYESTGIFFKSLEIPVKEISTVPIKSGTLTLELPQNYAFTYLSYESNLTVVSKNIRVWDVTENMPEVIGFEYSYIPLKVGNIRGSLLFWIILDLILLTLLVLQFVKEIKKRREE